MSPPSNEKARIACVAECRRGGWLVCFFIFQVLRAARGAPVSPVSGYGSTARPTTVLTAGGLRAAGAGGERLYPGWGGTHGDPPTSVKRRHSKLLGEAGRLSTAFAVGGHRSERRRGGLVVPARPGLGARVWTSLHQSPISGAPARPKPAVPSPTSSITRCLPASSATCPRQQRLRRSATRTISRCDHSKSISGILSPA